MTVNEYLEQNDLDYVDVVIVDTEGKKVEVNTLIQYCKVVGVDGNKVTIE